ncbi:hypothetical protein DPMN_038013 [Dreissena polymorpha]|uniref:Uncharacterized protein n=1 Tax=Dreissena polymorpha TaxID=45954 RepID=A0A9D4MCC4_DREPO|nr:hypothetical protein DPMN_038013 [Dreissena polymorpha]
MNQPGISVRSEYIHYTGFAQGFPKKVNECKNARFGRNNSHTTLILLLLSEKQGKSNGDCGIQYY